MLPDDPMSARAPAPQGEERSAPVRAHLTRRRMLFGAAGVLGLSTASTAVYASAVEPQGLVVTRYAPAPPGWPAERGLTITVIADLHAGGPDMLLPHVRHVVDSANALQSDLVVLLGDYTAWYEFPTESVAPTLWSAELARLHAPLGASAR